MQSVSTLMDGELNVDEAAREIARLKSDASARDQWDTYHLIGDAMRGSTGGSAAFAARFSERLALEPTVLAPRPRLTRKMQTYALSAAASVAAVAVVGWMTLSVIKPAVPDGTLAKAPTVEAPSKLATLQPPATAAIVPVAKDLSAADEAAAEPVQEYLLAHQGISPTTAIQGVTPYIRTVSSTGE